MAPVLQILCGENPEIPDLSVSRITQFLGLEYKFILINDLKEGLSHPRHAETQRLSVAMSYSTLVKLFKQGRLDDLETFLKEQNPSLLIYCITPEMSGNEVLRRITDSGIKDVSCFDDNTYEYKITAESKQISGEFAGLSFGPINNLYDFKFEISQLNKRAENIITVNNDPVFLRIKKDNSEMFLLAVGEILDIQEQSDQPLTTKRHFSRIAPVVMFLKYEFGDYCWHPKNKQACLVIDDPLLKSRYGFLEYTTLVKLMEEKGFATSIGFIPWNYERTDPETASLFRENRERFSISIHGCDHSKSEFGIIDPEEINRKVKLATEKMKYHAKSQGLSFGKVMIFPQGVFSEESMSVLKANNFLAAVNTEAISANTTPRLKICDFMKPAILMYDNFPLFLRRYPCDVSDFAFDLFLGRLAIIVIHHDYLKDRYGALSELIDKINAIDRGIKWNSLEKIIENSYWERTASDGSIHVEVYASRATIRNNSGRKLKYLISKEENQNIPVSEVKINGSAVSYQVNGCGLVLTRDMDADEAIDFEVIYQDIYGPPGVKKDGVIQSQKTRFRRYLSELRDNILCKNDLLLTTAHRIKRLVS